MFFVQIYNKTYGNDNSPPVLYSLFPHAKMHPGSLYDIQIAVTITAYHSDMVVGLRMHKVPHWRRPRTLPRALP